MQQRGNNIDAASLSTQNDVVGFVAKKSSVASDKALDPDLASSLKYLLVSEQSKKEYCELLEKYQAPVNCRTLCVPKVIAVIWDSLQPKTQIMG